MARFIGTPTFLLIIWSLAFGRAVAQDRVDGVNGVNNVNVTEREGRIYTTREHGLPPARDTSGFVRLLPAHGLQGWSIIGGDAVIERDGDSLHGHGNAGRNTFLVSDRTFGDFVLEGEIMINEGGNSGWQVRSHRNVPGDRNSGVRGYQIEVDSSSRNWSGGFYDELRRGWIHSFAEDPSAREAFRNNEWNHYRIECDGPHVRTWVNGIACADVIDFADLQGVIAFQVHSGNCDVRWKNLRIQEKGTSGFRSMDPWSGGVGLFRSANGSTVARAGFEPVTISNELDGGDSTIRMRYELDGRAIVRLRPEDSKKSLLTVHLENDVREGRSKAMTASENGSEESRFPVVAEGAGVDVSKVDSGQELIIDVEGCRLTVILDGSVLHRVRTDEPMVPKRIEIELLPKESEIRIQESLAIKRTRPIPRN